MDPNATLRRGGDGNSDAETVLLVTTPSGFVKAFRLDDAEVTVAGRDPRVPISIPDESVSRKHVEFRARPFAVRDLGSTNGTRVQGMRIAANVWVPISVGMVVEVGDAVVFVRAANTHPEEVGIPHKRADRKKEVPSDGNIVVDEAMVRLYSLVDLVGPSRMSVLILGETGVGKEVIANAVHRASDRRNERFLSLNCAAIAPSLLEAELFGFERGAFTGANSAKAGLFESANGGTVFLDEVGEMPLETQAALLRVLESGEVLRVGALKPTTVDVRFVAATHRDLTALAEEGRFRLDLLFRISGVTLAVPPLRERKADIVPLATFFLKRARDVGAVGFTGAAIDALVSHVWPGNVRELKNTIERAELLSRGDIVDVGHLSFGVGVALTDDVRRTGPTAMPPRARESVPAFLPRDPLMGTVPRVPARAPVPSNLEYDGPTPFVGAFRNEVAELERQRILEALEACGGNQSRAAKMLGISRATLIRRLEAYGVVRPRK
ncbi:MAG: sigma 54-interacting transcriptional regulator [Polyangiaceae bacterium]